MSETEDELGERFDCDACGLAFWVVANNDAEIMFEGLKIEFCPRCGVCLDGDVEGRIAQRMAEMGGGE